MVVEQEEEKHLDLYINKRTHCKFQQTRRYISGWSRDRLTNRQMARSC